MAHASVIEKAKSKMKKLRATRKNAKAIEDKKRSDLGEKEYLQKQSERFEKTTKEKLDVAIWDYRHKQFPMSKLSYFKELLKKRLSELTTNPEDQAEKIKIEGIINELSN